MRKLFSFFAAMLIALTVSASQTTLGSDNPKDVHADAISAVISSYDTINLKAGIYTESGRIAVSSGTKVIQAISDTVIIKTVKDNQVSGGAKVKYDGIFFDASNNTSYRGFTANDASAGKELRFNNCEFYNFPKYVISTASESFTIDSVIVTNCYFHNNTRGNIYFPESKVDNQETCYGLIVKNSTFANNDASGDWTSIVDVEAKASPAENIKVLVDHCTFYNNLTIGDGHASVRTHNVLNAQVSNCIFAHPTEYARRATYMDANPSYAKNCIAYNLTVDADHQGHTWMTQRTNCTMQDPLFTNAAGGDFSLKGNWVTMELSPARGAATDGSNLGDPRWVATETLPQVDFADPYQFIGTKAVLVGQIGLDANNHIVYYDTNDKGTATWKIHATRACELIATLNVNAASSSGHKFKVEVLDENGTSIAEPAEAAQTADPGDIELADHVVIPAEGNYTIKLYNLTPWSSAIIDGVTFAEVAAPVLPKISIAGSMNSWSTNAAVMIPAEDGKSASVTITLDDWYYEFKVVEDDSKWLSLGDDAVNLYTLKRDWNKVSGLEEGKQNFKLTPDVVPGDYTFKWTYATGELEVIFPEKIPTVTIGGEMNEWSASANVLTPAQDKLTASATIALEAKNYAFKVVVDGHWLALDADHNLTRENNSVADVNQEIANGPNLIVNADVAGDYTFTWTYATNTLAITFPAAPVPAKFYVLGLDGKWNEEDAVRSDEDSYVAALEAGYYEMKVLVDGTWATEKGYDDLTEVAAGLSKNETYGNICFTLAEAGNVTITYIEGSVFKLEGNFYVAPVVRPSIKLHGNFFGEWANTDEFKLSQEKDYAYLTLTLAAGSYEFGMRIGGDDNWTANGAAFTKGDQEHEITAGSGNLTLVAPQAGYYTFHWTFEDNTLFIAFPGDATGLDNTQIEKVVKTIENGQLIIIKNGVRYNAQGAIVK